MIVLDHNIAHDQAQRLRRRRIHFRQVGFEVGRPEWDDQQEILRYLHATKQPTFFTRDLGFYRAPLRHANYCLVALTVPVMETAQTFPSCYVTLALTPEPSATEKSSES